MSEVTPKLEGPGNPDIKLSPADLARSYLGHKGAEVQRQIKSTEHSIDFNSKYEPTHPGSGPDSDGGGDISDWNAARLEYDQWPEEREEILEQEQGRLDQLNGEAGRLARYVSEVNLGNDNLIGRFSNLEIERRAIIEARRKVEQARKEGREFEGADSLKGQIDEIVAAVGSEPRKDTWGTTARFRKMPGGWELNAYYPRGGVDTGRGMSGGDEKVIFDHVHEGGNSSVSSDVDMDVSFTSEAGGYSVRIYDFTDPTFEKSDKGEERPKAKIGKYTSFKIKDGKIFNPQAEDAVDDDNYPTNRWTRPSGSGTVFNQENFDYAKGVIAGLHTSVQTTPFPPQL